MGVINVQKGQRPLRINGFARWLHHQQQLLRLLSPSPVESPADGSANCMAGFQFFIILIAQGFNGNVIVCISPYSFICKKPTQHFDIGGCKSIHSPLGKSLFQQEQIIMQLKIIKNMPPSSLVQFLKTIPSTVASGKATLLFFTRLGLIHVWWICV